MRRRIVAIAVLALAAFTIGAAGTPSAIPPKAPEWARWALLERTGLQVTYSRKTIRTRNGWALITPPKPAKPYRVHVRTDCRSLIVPAYPGLVPDWETF